MNQKGLIIVVISLVIIVLGLGGYLFITSQNKTNNNNVNENAVSNEVIIDNMSFKLEEITIKKGQTVTWVNKESLDHNVNSNDGTFSSGILSRNEKYSFTFNNIGSYEYYCSIHPMMVGKVIVTE
jgi:amicyanin